MPDSYSAVLERLLTAGTPGTSMRTVYPGWCTTGPATLPVHLPRYTTPGTAPPPSCTTVTPVTSRPALGPLVASRPGPGPLFGREATREVRQGGKLPDGRPGCRPGAGREPCRIAGSQQYSGITSEVPDPAAGRFCHIPLKDRARSRVIPHFLDLPGELTLDSVTFLTPRCRKEPRIGPVLPGPGFLPVSRVDS